MSLIAVVSDSHDDLDNIAIFFDILKNYNIKAIIHCGDMAKPKTADFFLDNFSGDIHLIAGNAIINESVVANHCQISNHCKFYPDFGELVVDDWRLAFCHFPELAETLAISRKYQYVFYGHTHKPWLKQKAGTFMANPGTLKGDIKQASFALWDSDSGKIELKILG